MKKSVILVIAICLLIIAGYLVFTKMNVSEKELTNDELTTKTEESYKSVKEPDTKMEKTELKKVNDKIIQKAHVEKDNIIIKKANLYDDTPGSMMPLSAISVVSALPQNIQDKVSKISETNSIYMINKKNDKIFIISDNPANLRHGIEFDEINLVNGHLTTTTLGYNDKMQDSDNDKWEFNATNHKPIKHIKYNTDGDIEFVEVWNYDDNNPIKYEMKDGNNNVISLRKETLENGTNLRIEHLVYDKDGKTKINVSSTYEGADIKRFTYYNDEDIADSGSIFGEYSDEGLKIKETKYTSDLKVKNVYTSSYDNGIRKDLTVLDNKNNELEKIISD